MTTTYLRPLVGGRINQYANSAGQVYYHDTVAGRRGTLFPSRRPVNSSQGRAADSNTGQDTWTLDTTKSWPQWNNSRTGRAVLINPNPPPPQTYLDDINIKAALDLLVRETVSVNTHPDFCLFKVSQRPGGTLYQYEFMLVESKKPGEAWASTEDHLHDHLEGNGNDSKNCYGMVQIGLDVHFYKYENSNFSRIGGRMHLINDANNVVVWGRHIKDSPMPFV
ncbi:hypothetical protein EJ07DRAFT_156351 [Lizonia empirigonia]|nr:hypothetical protein EJ07DRAFT_156351 [Lizonia empirigonia]